MSAVASSFGQQLGDAAGERDDTELRERALAERCLQAVEERLGVAAVRDGEQHAEAAAADAARQVARAGHVVEHARDRGEHLVGCEVADARVDRREAVDVEHEQRERLTSSSRSSDLAVEQGVERGPVVEIRQRIAIRARDPARAARATSRAPAA